MKDKKLNFKEFLQENGVDLKAFKRDCANSNSAWWCGLYPRSHPLYELGVAVASYDWLTEAFRWDNTTQGFDYWEELYVKWEKMEGTFTSDNIEFGFSEYYIGDLYEK